jgi:hypothetical protein
MAGLMTKLAVTVEIVSRHTVGVALMGADMGEVMETTIYNGQ